MVLRFDQMEDIANWAWMEVVTWSNQPPSEDEYDLEDEYGLEEEGYGEEDEYDDIEGNMLLDAPEEEAQLEGQQQATEGPQGSVAISRGAPTPGQATPQATSAKGTPG